MEHPLLSRFKGGLLGSYLGEGLGRSYQRNPSGQNWLNFPQDHLLEWSRISTCTLESLVKFGSFTHDAYLEEMCFAESSLLNLKNKANSAELAVATLPIALFFHEISNLQRANLTKSAQIWAKDGYDHQSMLIWSYSLSLALKEKLNPVNLISQIISYCRGIETPLIRQLEQVEIFISQGLPLQQVVTCLSREGQKNYTPIALAFYCFLATPANFRLGVLRAVQTGYYPTLTAALTGALGGVYNSFSGIPSRWRLVIKKHLTSQKIASLATKLFSVWSGVEQLNDNHKLLNIAAVASPKILQSRPQLRIISQEE